MPTDSTMYVLDVNSKQVSRRVLMRLVGMRSVVVLTDPYGFFAAQAQQPSKRDLVAFPDSVTVFDLIHRNAYQGVIDGRYKATDGFLN